MTKGGYNKKLACAEPATLELEVESAKECTVESGTINSLVHS